MYKHWNPNLCQSKALVKWKDLLTGTWKGSNILSTQGRGHACIFPQDAPGPRWLPERLVRFAGHDVDTGSSADVPAAIGAE